LFCVVNSISFAKSAVLKIMTIRIKTRKNRGLAEMGEKTLNLSSGQAMAPILPPWAGV